MNSCTLLPENIVNLSGNATLISVKATTQKCEKSSPRIIKKQVVTIHCTWKAQVKRFIHQRAVDEFHDRDMNLQLHCSM
ncbi:hypothetical protein PsorP6_002677 [Peronosclerospora sorghi]|uniref:Uncharacterized protein n=1 Tax=Peronosclerospora sorghi TaxID=230839 RepID=A0ACC0WT11_9STRA|nr:hypothetical protein PsorP6_002677 [Peronosclerospora sorghi]